MGFNPLDEKGIPLDQQLRTWSELNVEPYRPLDVDPYTRARVIAMNGIEVESIMFSHQFNRHTDDADLKAALARVRYVEQQQQTAVSWLIPAQESTLEVVLGYEQLATDITAYIARMEPDPYLTQVYQFGLLEDFDHLYRYANLYELTEGKKAQAVVDYITEVMPGRPTAQHHRDNADHNRLHFDQHTVDPLSRMHAMTITALEQQTMNYYMNVGNRFVEPVARALYAEIAQVEEEHVTQYESLIDPATSWLENLLHHEYNECYMYWSFSQDESDARIRAIWDLHLAMEITHLQEAARLLERYEGRSAAEVLPPEMPEPQRMQPNKEYIRSVIADQVDLTAFGTGFVREWPDRYLRQMEAVNGEQPPSEEVVERNRAAQGRDYRIETEGPHPVERLRQQEATA